jgi:hypothetical protein
VGRLVVVIVGAKTLQRSMSPKCIGMWLFGWMDDFKPSSGMRIPFVSVSPKECECDKVIMSVFWCGEKRVGVDVVVVCCRKGKT